MWRNQAEIVEFLKQDYRARSEANPRYSIRAFARHLSLSPGELSEILAGKRKLTLRTAGKISAGLRLTPNERQSLINALDEASIPPRAVDPEDVLGADAFALVSDWYCFALLNLFQTRNCPTRVERLALRLGIRTEQAKLAIERLRRVGLIERRGLRFVPTHRPLRTGGTIPSATVRQYHRRILSLAEGALDTQDVTEREFQGISFAIRKEDIPRIKRRVAEVASEIAREFDSPELADEVYHLQMSLFRLSQTLGESDA